MWWDRQDTFKPLGMSGSSVVSGDGWPGRVVLASSGAAVEHRGGESRCSSFIYKTK